MAKSQKTNKRVSIKQKTLFCTADDTDVHGENERRSYLLCLILEAQKHNINNDTRQAFCKERARARLPHWMLMLQGWLFWKLGGGSTEETEAVKTN